MTTELQKAFERDTGLEFEQEGAEYARDHYIGGWQASREHIRAKLQSGVMVEKVAAALFENEKKTMGDAWYHPSETFKGLGSIAAEPWIKNAKAAIAAVLEGI